MIFYNVNRQCFNNELLNNYLILFNEKCWPCTDGRVGKSTLEEPRLNGVNAKIVRGQSEKRTGGAAAGATGRRHSAADGTSAGAKGRVRADTDPETSSGLAVAKRDASHELSLRRGRGQENARAAE